MIKHERAATAKIVKVDLDGFHVRNHKNLLNKWKIYFKKRNFDYKILIKRAGAVGDAIMVTPIIKALKNRYPLSEITIHTVCPQVFENNPDVANIINGDFNPDDYDMFLNLIWHTKKIQKSI